MLVKRTGKNQYKEGLVCQIYPRSFKDSDENSIGDLNDITSRLEYIADIGADTLCQRSIPVRSLTSAVTSLIIPMSTRITVL